VSPPLLKICGSYPILNVYYLLLFTGKYSAQNMMGARVKQLTIPANTTYHMILDEPAGIYIISA